jgi:(S)-2-hydroxyglutarate dehydrogenase
MKTEQYDYVIIGAGIIGLTIAYNMQKKYPTKKIIIIEKEPDICYHSSGRNSGVLHAGFYYTADSLKAKFTKDGNKELTDYCLRNNLKINQCGKVVVAKHEDELVPLFELEKRGKVNGVNVKIIDEKELAVLDGNIKTHKYALYSPNTSTIDPIEVCTSIRNDLLKNGVVFHLNCRYKRRISNNAIDTTSGRFESDMIINAAGLYADKIARDFGFCKNYVIIPFKGIYLKYKGTDKPVTTNVYPVPNLKNPFLGVHFTVTVDGTVKIGPTAIPALWRENYTTMKNFKFNEFLQVTFYEAKLFLLDSFGFRALAFEEIKKYHKDYFINLAADMVYTIDKKYFNGWSRPGIRAQLLDVRTNMLVQDFIVESDRNSVHILNAVSPAFTSSFPFSKWIVDNYVK